MKRIILSIIFLFLFLPNAHAFNFDLSSIYSTSSYINDISIYQNTVAWSEMSGSGSVIKYWNGSDVQTLDNLGYRDNYYVSLSEGKASWMAAPYKEDWDILFWNGTSTSVLHGKTNDEMFPSLDGSNLARYENKTNSIVYYNSTQITSAGSNQLPSVDNGQVAYQKDNDVYLWNGTSEQPIYSSTSDNWEPSLSNGQIAWWNSSNGVMFWDGVSTDIIDNGAFPALSNGNIIYENGAEIFFWDGAGITQLTDRSAGWGASHSADIDSNYFGWVTAEKNGNYQIYLGKVANVVPEPASILLLGFGLVGMGLRRKK